jgi:hypothetical protein
MRHKIERKCCLNFHGADCRGKYNDNSDVKEVLSVYVAAILKSNRAWLTNFENRADVVSFLLFIFPACPGGLGTPCFGRGQCDDGLTGTGTCNCTKPFYGTACERCPNNTFCPGKVLEALWLRHNIVGAVKYSAEFQISDILKCLHYRLKTFDLFCHSSRLLQRERRRMSRVCHVFR